VVPIHLHVPMVVPIVQKEGHEGILQAVPSAGLEAKQPRSQPRWKKRQ
jgi:hypothetical protein